ncbi:hypothetical protein GCM10023085_32670 [Actinomadura viridis]|uniref:DUF4097 domain-containing protein n=1 Tax=Actinomadura viridis TaxID=58110 RepID=A0A931GH17_9ACTN|nr:DUF4097 family beta strand repeat-containing protein [Actinomadura viridis]MBG6086945.1 hypothetical protein [Actinomadura viridis]
MKTLRGVAVVTGAVALAATAMTGCAVSFDTGSHKETRSYDVPGSFTALKVTGDSSRLEVTGTDTRVIKVQETRTWSSEKNKPRTRRTTEGGTLALRFTCAQQIIGYSRCEIAYRIEVPRAMAVDLRTDSGALVATGLNGDSVRLSTDSGPLTARRLHTKALSASSDAGQIRIDGQAGTARLSTDSGGVEAEGLRAGQVVARSSAGAVRLGLAGPPDGVDVSTDSGSVRLHLPGDQGYALTVTTDSGSRNISPEIRQDSTSRYRVKLKTDSGSVTVSPVST